MASLAPDLVVAATAALLLGLGAAQAADECGSSDDDFVVTCGTADYDDGITHTVSGSDGLELQLVGDGDTDTGVHTVGGNGLMVTGVVQARVILSCIWRMA